MLKKYKEAIYVFIVIALALSACFGAIKLNQNDNARNEKVASKIEKQTDKIDNLNKSMKFTSERITALEKANSDKSKMIAELQK